MGTDISVIQKSGESMVSDGGRYLGFGVCCTSLLALVTSLLAVVNWEPLNWHFMHNFLFLATT